MSTLASSTSLVPQSSRACAKSSSIQACSFSGLRPVRNSPCFTIKNAPAMTDRCIGCPKRASALCVETMPHPTGNKEKDKAFADCDAYPTGGISHPHSGGLLGSPRLMRVLSTRCSCQSSDLLCFEFHPLTWNPLSFWSSSTLQSHHLQSHQLCLCFASACFLQSFLWRCSGNWHWTTLPTISHGGLTKNPSVEMPPSRSASPLSSSPTFLIASASSPASPLDDRCSDPRGLLGSPSDTIARLCRLGRCCFIACRTHGIRIGCIIKQELARIPCMSPGGLCFLRRLFLGRSALVLPATHNQNQTSGL